MILTLMIQMVLTSLNDASLYEQTHQDRSGNNGFNSANRSLGSFLQVSREYNCALYSQI